PNIPYLLLDGTVVADGWSGLTSSSLQHGIDMNEKLATQTNAEVWTATVANGTYAGSSCTDWTMADHSETADVGLTSNTDYTWTTIYLQFCDYDYQRLYCFQQ